MKKRYLKKSLQPLLYIAGVSFSTLVLAGGIEVPPSGSGAYFSMFGGANWIVSGQSSSVNFSGDPTNLATNLYVASSSTSRVGPMVGVDVGYHWESMSRHFWLNAGVETSYTEMTSAYGIVYPLFYISPNFDTLSFNYEAQAVPLFGEFTLGAKFLRVVEPYIIGGVGVSWNRAFNYNEVPTAPNLTALPMRTMFNARTQSEFAWNVGAGLGFQATPSTTISLEYRYTDYGNLALNATPGQATNEAPSLGALTSNALLARMTVVFASQ